MASFFLAGKSSVVHVLPCLPLHSSAVGDLHYWVHELAVVNSAAINVGTSVSADN